MQQRAIVLESAPTEEDEDNPQQVPSFEPEIWGPNISANNSTNAIDPLVHTATISGGGYVGREQYIGNVDIDPTYQPGSARIATIGGGYDNLNNQLAGTIAGGAHHKLLGAGDHGTIGGGSYNSIETGSYSTIAGGGGEAAPQSVSGDRSTISGGGGNLIDADMATVSGGFNNTVTGTNSIAAGGRDNYVAAANSLVTGNANYVEAAANASLTAGHQVVTTTPGSLNISARGAAGQTIVFNLNNSTSGTTPAILLGSGIWTTPIIPDASIWTGQALIIGVNDAGEVASYRFSFTANDSTVLHSATERQVDQIGLDANPIALNINGSLGRFELTATGIEENSIDWNAAVIASQVRTN